jgi:hypothetical protein
MGNVEEYFKRQQAQAQPEPIEPTSPTQQPISRAAKYPWVTREGDKSKSNLNIVKPLSPEKEAEAYALSKKTGQPLSVVRHAFDETKDVALRADNIPRSTIVKDYLGRSYDISAISQDDVNELEEVVSTWDKTKRAFEEGDINSKINILTTRRELFGFDPDAVNAEIDRLNALRRDRVEPEGFIEKVTTAAARQLPQMLASAERGIERSVQGAITGVSAALLAGQVPPLTATPEEIATVPAGFFGGAGLGFKFGQIEGIFTQEFGGAFQEFSEITDEAGNKIDPAIVKIMALGVGSFNAILEFASFKALAKTIPGGEALITKMTPDIIRKAAISKTAKAAFAKIAANAGKAWTTEVGTEVLQESITVLLGEISKILQTQLTGAEFKDFDFDVFQARIGEIVKETAYSALGFILPGTAISTAKVATDATISKNFNDDNNQMSEAIKKTKTSERSGDHTEQFLDMLGMGEPVFISPEGIDELYLQSTKEEADAILTKLGKNPDDAKQTAAMGQDVEIKQSKPHSQLEIDEYNKIKNDLKPAPSAYTQRELDAQVADDDIANAVKLVEEQAILDKEVGVEIARITKEIEESGQLKEVAENVPILMKGLADRLSLEGRPVKETLGKVGVQKVSLVRGLIDKGKQLFQGKKDPIKLPKELQTAYVDPEVELMASLEHMQALELKLRAYDIIPEQDSVVQLFKKETEEQLDSITDQIKDVVLKSYDEWLSMHDSGRGWVNSIIDPEGEQGFFDRPSNAFENGVVGIINMGVWNINVEQDVLDAVNEEFAPEPLPESRKEIISELEEFGDVDETEDLDELQDRLRDIRAEQDPDKLLFEIDSGVEIGGIIDASGWDSPIGQTTLKVMETKGYEAWRDFWGQSLSEAENRIRDQKERLDTATDVNNKVVAINLALNEQHVSGTMGDRLDISQDDLDVLSAMGDNIKDLRDLVSPERKRFFQAQEGAPPKGSIPITNESHLISLYEGADLSTLLHETAHIALKEYTALEVAGQASESLKKDMSVVREWVGAAPGAELTIEQSEKFAEGFEAYLLEGKAPTPALETAFARFRRWLVEVYKTVKNLDVKLDNKIRGVFDRMLSANIEVEAMAQVSGFTVKTDAELDTLGVIKEDRAFMKRSIETGLAKAEKRLSQKRNKGFKDKNATWKKEARREVKRENPTYGIIDEIITQKKQINRDEFIDRYGQDVVDRLPNKRILKKDGESVDMVAVFFEYDDADSMVAVMVATPPFSEAVNQRVNEKRARHDAQYKAEDFLVDLKEYRDYLDILSRYLGNNLKESDLSAREKKLATRSSLKRFAKQVLDATSVREARRVDKYMSAMKKAQNDERRAILRKDWGAAARANEKSRLNYELASQSAKIREETDKIIKRSKKAGRQSSKTLDIEHKEAILHLISRFNLAPMVPQKPQEIPNYSSLFAPTEFSSGYDVPDFMLNNLTKDYRDLSIERLRDLDGAIQFLRKQGNPQDKNLTKDGMLIDEQIVTPGVEVTRKFKPKKVWDESSMMRKLTDPMRKFFSRLDSLEFVIKSVDGYQNLGGAGTKGIFEQNVIDQIKDDDNLRIELKEEIARQVTPHLTQIGKTMRKWRKQFGRRMQIEGAPVPGILVNDGQFKGWKPQQIFSIMLNLGNESNLKRLQDGYGDLTDDTIETLKDLLTKEDWKAVQGIWDAMESLFRDTDRVHVNMEGYHITKIDKRPVRTEHGIFEGGYYPAKYDPNLDFGVEDRKEVENFFAGEASSFSAPYAKKGHTIKRVNGVHLPMLLDLSVINNHFDDTIQYIAFAETIRDADRITRHPVFKNEAIRILGKDVYKSIRPALKHIANPRRAGLDLPGGRLVEWMRGLSTAYILAWNTGVAIKQPLSTFSAIQTLQKKEGIIKGLTTYLSGFSSVMMAPSLHYKKMLELSTYMRNRMGNFDRELRSEFSKMSGEQRALYFGDSTVTWQDVVNLGFWQIRAADTVTVMPIWHGAFESKLNVDQSNLNEAIRYADNVVRNTQPSAQALDLSAWQRDGGVIRLLSQFQTFTVGKYGQRQRLHYRAWKQGAITTKEYAWFNFMDGFVPLAAINLLQAIIWGRDMEDDKTQKDILLSVLSSWALMGVPLANNMINAINFGEPINSPVFKTANQAIMGVVKGGKGVATGFKNRKERDAALWGIANATSILSRVPVTKVVSKAQKGEKQKKGVPGLKHLVPAPKGKQ